MNIHQFIQTERLNQKGSNGGDYVYVVLNPKTNLFKIGQTKDLRRRLRELDNQNGLELIHFLSCWTDGGYYESAGWIENSLHKWFKSKRMKGEWFNLSKWDAIRLTLLFRDSFECEKDYLLDCKYFSNKMNH